MGITEEHASYAVLVVEAESERKRFLSRQLSQFKAPVRFARAPSTHQALRLLAKQDYQIILTDHQPPRIDSIKLLESLKDFKVYIPTIVITERSNHRLARSVLKKGAFDYLSREESQTVFLPHLFAAALERKRLEDEINLATERLRDLAIRDGLTGLYNHRHLCELIEQEFQRARRYRHPLSFLMMDIDYFKVINDTYGHRVGDHALTEVAQILSRSVRGVDVVARYGGDEFAVLLPETSGGAALSIAERIHATLHQRKITYEAHSLYVSMSIGVASLLPHMMSKDELVTLADKALYEAKNQGRDRILTAQPLAPTNPALLENLKPIQEISQQIQVITAEVKRTYLEIILQYIQRQRNFTEYLKDHSERVAHWAVQIAAAVGLEGDDVESVRVASLLHDIGKVAIDEKLLCKRDGMTSLELGLIRKHPIIGAKMLQDIRFLEREIPLILHHHERYDGQGYPFKLRGDEIPFGARIICIAEAWDAMTEPQPYREVASRAHALKEIKKGAGTQFDPHLVPPFLEIVGIFKD